jgi:chromosome segregation ATPase
MFANKKDLELAQSKINSLEGDLTALQASLTEAQATIAEQTETIATLRESITTISAERDTASESLAQAQSQIAALEADIVTANTSAEARAAEIVAQAGIAPVEATVDENLTPSNEKTLNEFNQLTPADRMAFVRNGGKIIN